MGGSSSVHGIGLAFFAIAERFADGEFFEPGNANDIAGHAVDNFAGLEAAELPDLRDRRAFAFAVLVDAHDRIADFHVTAGDLADGDASHVIAPVEIADEHLKGRLDIGGGRGNMFHDGLEERGHPIVFVLESLDGVTVARAGVNERGIELFFRGVEFQEQLQHLVVHLVRVGVLAVDLVDDHDDFQAVGEGFLQDEASLRLRAVECVDEQQHAIDHAEDAFDFAAEIGVAGGIDDIDRVAAPMDGGVLGLDGDALFLLEVHGIHGAFFHGLVGAIHPTLAQELVHQRRFAVVNVRNNTDIPKFAVHKLRPRRELTPQKAEQCSG